VAADGPAAGGKYITPSGLNGTFIAPAGYYIWCGGRLRSRPTISGVSMTGKEKPKNHVEDERARIEKEEDQVTLDSDESFPASDPPSFNPGVTGAADVKKKKD
jgi:hypothetical protein